MSCDSIFWLITSAISMDKYRLILKLNNKMSNHTGCPSGYYRNKKNIVQHKEHFMSLYRCHLPPYTGSF